MTEEKKKTLESALLGVQKELENPKTDKVNPHFKNKYVSLGALLDLVRPVLTKHGLVLIQGVDQMNDGWTLWTHLVGDMGELINLVPLLPEKPGPQGMGSALTYARRQGICAILGLAGEDDDDGEAAQEIVTKAAEKQEKVDDIKAKTQEDNVITKDIKARIDRMIVEMINEDDAGAYADKIKELSLFVDKENKPHFVLEVDKLSEKWAQSVYRKAKDEFQDWAKRNSVDISHFWEA